MSSLQMLMQTWSRSLIVALQALFILLVTWLLQRLIRHMVARIGERHPVLPELLLPLHGGPRWLIIVSALTMVLKHLGMSAEVLWTALTGSAAVAAVALFAIQSALSNLFCASLIFTAGSFRIGGRVELISSVDKPGVTGRMVTINLSYTTLEETLEDNSPGPLLQASNSLFFQRIVRRRRGPDFSIPTKNEK